MTDRIVASWGIAIALLAVSAAVTLWPSGNGGLARVAAPAGHAPNMPGPGPWIDQVAGRVGVTRRPAAEASPDEASLEGYTLTGVVETDGEMWALIERGGESRSYRSGAEIDGFRLVQIEPERVIFERDGSEVVLRLMR